MPRAPGAIPDQGLLQGHQGSVDGHRDHRQVEIVEHDGHLVVQALAGMEVQAERPAADRRGARWVLQPARQARGRVSDGAIAASVHADPVTASPRPPAAMAMPQPSEPCEERLVEAAFPVTGR